MPDRCASICSHLPAPTPIHRLSNHAPPPDRPAPTCQVKHRNQFAIGTAGVPAVVACGFQAKEDELIEALRRGTRAVAGGLDDEQRAEAAASCRRLELALGRRQLCSHIVLQGEQSVAGISAMPKAGLH